MAMISPGAVVVLSSASLVLDDARLALFKQAASQQEQGVCVCVRKGCANYSFKELSRFLSLAYTKLAQLLPPMAEINIVFEDLRQRGKSGIQPLEEILVANNPQIRVIYEDERETSAQSQEINDFGKFGTVALGGTFDHLHPGHKVLLTMSAWIAAERLIVGITDEILLNKKKHKELLEPLEQRTEAVHNFLKLISLSNLRLDLPPLQDVYGPTASERDCHAMVVSRESMGGADAVAEKRREQNLPPLELFVIDIVAPDANSEADQEALISAKMSSTAIREFLATKPADSPKSTAV